MAKASGSVDSGPPNGIGLVTSAKKASLIEHRVSHIPFVRHACRPTAIGRCEVSRAAIDLRAGTARAIVDPERGGRIAGLGVGGRELVVGPADGPKPSISWGIFLMAPWPGRLADGR